MKLKVVEQKFKASEVRLPAVPTVRAADLNVEGGIMDAFGHFKARKKQIRGGGHWREHFIYHCGRS